MLAVWKSLLSRHHLFVERDRTIVSRSRLSCSVNGFSTCERACVLVLEACQLSEWFSGVRHVRVIWMGFGWHNAMRFDKGILHGAEEALCVCFPPAIGSSHVQTLMYTPFRTARCKLSVHKLPFRRIRLESLITSRCDGVSVCVRLFVSANGLRQQIFKLQVAGLKRSTGSARHTTCGFTIVTISGPAEKKTRQRYRRDRSEELNRSPAGRPLLPD